MKIFIKIIVCLALFLPAVVYAEDVLFFEFSPDYAQPQKLSADQTLVQTFLSVNDSLKSVNLWVDNAGAPGNLSVSLLDRRNIVLASKSISIGTLNPVYTGNKISVAFNSSIALNPGENYKIRLQSAIPRLRIYGVNKVQMVGHNEPYPISSVVGEATLDSAVQNYVVKFALFENTDSRAPIISNVSISTRDWAAKRITFNVDELVDYKLAYAPAGTQNFLTIDYAGYYSVCMAGVYNCYLDFSVADNTGYEYRLYAKDKFSNEAHYEGTFQNITPDQSGRNNNSNNPPENAADLKNGNASNNPGPAQNGSGSGENAAVEFSLPDSGKLNVYSGNSGVRLALDIGQPVRQAEGGRYAVDIFDSSGGLVKSSEVSGDVRKANIDSLREGEYFVSVSRKEDDGSYQKIGEAKISVKKSWLAGKYINYIFYTGLIAIMIIIGAVVIYIKKKTIKRL